MKTIGINFYLTEAEGKGVAFDPECNRGGAAYCRRLKEEFEKRYDVKVRTWDDVDYSRPDTFAVYFDYNWRHLLHDRVLKRVPFEKRVLILVEPSNVNPSAYVVPFLRNRFAEVVTWDESLLATHPEYHRTVPGPFQEPPDYPENRFADIPFADKKLLVAIAMNRHHWAPWSSHRLRRSAYRFFDRAAPGEFDLFGKGWEREGFVNCYRGFLDGPKVPTMAHYRFTLCYENNGVQRGYVTEKIADAICARCVPVYYGAPDIERRVPRECFIDARRFRSLEEMREFLVSMSESEHARYLHAMDEFCKSDLAKKFTRDYHFDTIAAVLELKRQSKFSIK